MLGEGLSFIWCIFVQGAELARVIIGFDVAAVKGKMRFGLSRWRNRACGAEIGRNTLTRGGLLLPGPRRLWAAGRLGRARTCFLQKCTNNETLGGIGPREAGLLASIDGRGSWGIGDPATNK